MKFMQLFHVKLWFLRFEISYINKALDIIIEYCERSGMRIWTWVHDTGC